MTAAASPTSQAQDSAPDVEAELRAALAAGGTQGGVLWDHWPALAAFADRDPEMLARLLDAAAGPGAPDASGARVEGDAVAFGMAGPGGRGLRGDARFRAWVGGAAEAVDALELARRAAAQGRASGRVRTMDHGVLAAVALAGPAASPWLALARRREGFGADAGDKGILLVVFAPSRSAALIGRAADALGLAPLQRRVALALLEEPSLDAAALRLGVGRDAAKEALKGALRKAGVKRSTQLIGRLIDVACQLPERPETHGAAAAAVLGLSPAEGGVAQRIAQGDTLEEAGAALRLKPGTVKAYRRGIFDKLGINRSRDLQRLITEAGELARLSALSEVDPQAPADGTLRIVNAAGGRTVAFIDHGPAEGRPVLVMHGYWTGRLAPPPLLAALRAAGRRAIVPQRPGFGLTSPAARDYVRVAGDDMALILDALNLANAAVLARDGGAPAALAFGVAHRDRLEAGRGVLLNPRPPKHVARGPSPLAALSAMLLRHPGLIEPYARMRLRQGNRAAFHSAFGRAFAAAPADAACFAREEVADHLAADTMGLVGRTLRGAIAEQSLYADGWRVDEAYEGPRWRLAFSGHFYLLGQENVWLGVSSGAPLILLEAGILAQFTHAEPLAALFPQ